MSEPQDPYQGAPHQPPNNPYGQPPSYTPPAYEPPPQSAPPPGGWGGWGGGQPGQWYPQQPPPPAPSSGRRTALISAAVVVVLAVAGVGTWLALRKDSSSPKKYGVPASFDGYTQVHGTAADRVDNAIRSMGTSAGGGAAKRIFDAATIGVYSHDTGDQPVLITLIVSTSASGSQGGDDVTREMLSGAVPDSTTFPSGSHGGSTRCGAATFGVAHETMCAWSDSRASGMLVSVNEAMTVPGLATITQSFRDATE